MTARKPDTAERITEVCNRLRDLLIAKNANYGDSAGEPPCYAPGLSPETALWVRLSDKASRLKALRANERDRVGESVTDTLLDQAGYSILLILELEK